MSRTWSIIFDSQIELLEAVSKLGLYGTHFGNEIQHIDTSFLINSLSQNTNHCKIFAARFYIRWNISSIHLRNFPHPYCPIPNELKFQPCNISVRFEQLAQTVFAQQS
jgi:hypothetical protein